MTLKSYAMLATAVASAALLAAYPRETYRFWILAAAVFTASHVVSRELLGETLQALEATWNPRETSHAYLAFAAALAAAYCQRSLDTALWVATGAIWAYAADPENESS